MERRMHALACFLEKADMEINPLGNESPDRHTESYSNKGT